VLVVFLRGINVGGHRTFRPSILAKALHRFDVVNIGAAGTFVVRRPGSRVRFRAELVRRLPFDTEIMICDAAELRRLEKESPFGTGPPAPDIVRFVSVLSKPGRFTASLPLSLPDRGQWLVRVLAVKDRFVFGMYRRHMKTIGCLGQLDKSFGAPATTRNWNTILSIVKVLQDREAAIVQAP